MNFNSPKELKLLRLALEEDFTLFARFFFKVLKGTKFEEFIENEFLPFLYEHGLVKPENENIINI